MAAEYGVEHLGTSMAASTPDVLRAALRRRYMAKLSMAAWRGYANLVLDRTKYVSFGRTGKNKAQIRQGMLDRSDASEHVGIWTAHDTDVPPRDAFPTGWGDGWMGRRSRLGLDRSTSL